MSDKETWNSDGPECPHCGYVMTPDEGSYFDGDGHTEECGDCEKSFYWTYHRHDNWLGVPVQPDQEQK